jgi:GNAT superfamily N-acetyltransferase
MPALKKVIDANGLFPSEMLDDMISDYFDNDNSSDFWLTYEDHEPVAIAYCAPEKMTKGTWNLYLIAVHPDCQGKGRGTSIMRYIEQMLILFNTIVQELIDRRSPEREWRSPNYHLVFSQVVIVSFLYF